jgi:hypothetical protein
MTVLIPTPRATFAINTCPHATFTDTYPLTMFAINSGWRATWPSTPAGVLQKRAGQGSH